MPKTNRLRSKSPMVLRERTLESIDVFDETNKTMATTKELPKSISPMMVRDFMER